MRIRTVYFKVRELEGALSFWSALLDTEPVKRFPAWCEFRVGEINLGLLPIKGSETQAPRGSCVPVFEFPDSEIQDRIRRAKELGARSILEGKEHPDFPKVAAVLVDPFGNEFELTSTHG